MNEAYSLLEEPWLPVRFADGRTVTLGLLEVFERSDEIVALADTSPPSLIAQYRVLLAIAHRALSRALGGWKEKDRRRWHSEGLPFPAIRDYLENWRERFWLFHAEHPFMQVAALATAQETRDKRKPWTQIALASANGNVPVMFDHAVDANPREISPADAVGMLLGFLQFTPGGLVKTLRDSDKAGALADTAAVLPVGATLARTLCLCLHPSPTGKVDDLPAWERKPLTLAELRGDPVLATGPNDRYTRQSRAVLLLREGNGNVRWLRFAAGLALGDDANAPDTMASYRAGTSTMVRLTFDEGRAVWRDLPALVPDATGKAAQPAAVLQYAITLHDSFDAVHQPLLVAGLASDQAKLLRWRAEQIVLPAALLADSDKAMRVRTLVGRAVNLYGDLRKLGTSLLADTLPDAGSKDTYTRARSLWDSGAFATTYFSVAERVLPQVLQRLGEGNNEPAETLWQQGLHAGARAVWSALLVTIGRSSRALRAEARSWPRFHRLLKVHLFNPESEFAKEA